MVAVERVSTPRVVVVLPARGKHVVDAVVKAPSVLEGWRLIVAMMWLKRG